MPFHHDVLSPQAQSNKASWPRIETSETVSQNKLSSFMLFSHVFVTVVEH
jgi:hypothetical protein